VTHEQLVRARCAELRALVADWQLERHVEIQEIIDPLGRDLVYVRT
jgi:hypothetical protein